MKNTISLKRIALALIPALILMGAAAWYGGVIGPPRFRPPAMFKYFSEPPKEIFIQAEPKK